MNQAIDPAKIEQAEIELKQLETAYADLAVDVSLTAASMAPPPFGTAADVVSVGRSLWRGDWGGALLDVVGIIPIVGDGIKGVAKGSKIAAKMKEVNAGIKAAKIKLAKMKKGQPASEAKKTQEATRKKTNNSSVQKCPKKAGSGTIGGKNKLQFLNGKPPRNSEFSGKNYSLDVDNNSVLKQRVEAQNPRLRKIRGKKLKRLAEKYPEGVNFTDKGFADFNPYVHKHRGKAVEVDIKRFNPNPASGKGSTGSQLDMRDANNAMKNLDPNWKQPPNTTWHHVENSTKLQLVPEDLHGVVGHSGGRSTYKF